ncbi:Phosphoenolpyruvate/pyruvate domain-containing protein [Meredithblackwellia eburnea MCA 4105]
MLPGANLARMVASFGYDFVLVDCEHGNIEDGEMHATVAAIASQGCSPIVRIPGPENFFVKRALDTGAHGLLCPMMSTAEQARDFVRCTKFPATKAMLAKDSTVYNGTRGAGSPFAPAVFGQNLQDYLDTANRNTFIAVQIESAEGLANCEEIAKVDGIDMLFCGPNDLCSSLGYPATQHPNIPEVQEAIKRILAACQAAGKFAGMFCTSADQIEARFAQGFDFMNLGADVVALGAWNAGELGKLRHIM